MRIVDSIARVLLGALFITFGLNGFFVFLTPPPMEEAGQRFIDLLIASRFLDVVKAIEVAGGMLLLWRRTVPLGLTLLGPVVVNIVLFHAFLAPSGLLVSLLPGGLWLFLIYRYRANFRTLLKAPVDA